jgi:predicted CXXCH cytochrome family protein
MLLLLGSSLALQQEVYAGNPRGGRDPIWSARTSGIPSWVDMAVSPSQLYTEYQFARLSGRLIHFGAVDGSGCFNRGLAEDGTATDCGMQSARQQSFQWQNQFNNAILETSQRSGVPPVLLKNIFAWESQFWPETAFVNTFEYGLGHMTMNGADSALRWNPTFYDTICASSFSAETCQVVYGLQPEHLRSILKGVVIQKVNADCGDCTYALDLPLAERSIPVFAETLLANASFVKQTITGYSGSDALDQISYEDLWKYTLTSYNAGPGCFLNAYLAQVRLGQDPSWKNLSRQLSPACRGAVPYVDFVSSTDSYFPDRDPILSILLTPLPEPTSTPTQAEAFPAVPSLTASPASPTPVQESTVALPSETPTSTAQEPGETHTPAPSATPDPQETSEPFQPPTPGPGSDDEVLPVLTATPTAAASAEPVDPPAPTALPPTDTATPPAEQVSPTQPAYTPTLTPTPPGSYEARATFTATPTLPPPAATPDPIADPHAGDEILVKINPRDREAGLKSLEEQGIHLERDIRPLSSLDFLLVKVAPEHLLPVLGSLQDAPGILIAEPNYLVTAAAQVNDPDFPFQPNLTAVQAPPAWNALTSMQEVLVAVLDTGVDVLHPDLADRIWQNAGEFGPDAANNDRRSNGIDDDENGYVDDWQGWNFVSSSSSLSDPHGHGTHLAGVIGAGLDNLTGIAGAAPNARLMPVTVLAADGSGTHAAVAEGIVYAVNAGARIINLGFGGPGSSRLLHSAVEYALSRNVLVIAAAGNHASPAVYYPAGYPGVIAVGAVDNDGYWANFSASGDHLALSAPGVNVYSTAPGGAYRSASGTSISAAHVSAAAALLLSQPQMSDPMLVKTVLYGSALDRGTPGKDPYFGYGVVQIYAALEDAGLLPASLPAPTPSGPGRPGMLALEELWGTAQIATYAITNPANSIDREFNDLLAYSTGPYGAAQARNWTFTVLDDTSFTTIASVVVDLRLYFSGWVNDWYYIQVFEPTNPACTLGWCTVMTLKGNPGGSNESPPPTVLTTLSIPVTDLLNTPAKINNAQVRLAGSGFTGGSADAVTVYFDGVRLRVQDVLPPTPTPSPTPPFVPTPTLPAFRPPTAVPGPDEPHSNFTIDRVDQCASCHRSHTAKSLELRSQQTEEQVCFACHGITGPGTNVQPAFTLKANTLTRFFVHDVFNTTRIHRSDEASGSTFGGANRHIECEDCHSSHSSARSAVPGSVLAPAIQQEMYNSAGVEPVWTAPGAPATYVWLETAEREYQVCLKCHSSFTTLPTYVPDGVSPLGYIADGLAKLTSTNPAQVNDSRDLAQEFNPYQVSFHPVAAQGRNTNMPPGSFVAPWNQNSILYCTDCHTNAAGETSGPHGSPNLHILDGAVEYITQTDPDQDCSPGGCPNIHDPGELCFKCHQYNTYARRSNPASTTYFRDGQRNLHAFHSFSSCYTCHDSHGSEQRFLLNFDAAVVSIYEGYNSQNAWEFNSATNLGTCYIACHAGDHGQDRRMQYSP